MPALLTHYSFARYAEENPSKPTLLGTQGPDCFFFYGHYPFKKREIKGIVDAFGRRLHKIDPALPYVTLFEIARESPHKEMLGEYLDGLLMHYSLDTTCHPYVFSKSGKSNDPKVSKLYSYSHMRFETMLDVLMREKFHIEAKPHQTLDIDPRDADAISILWQALNEKEHISESSLPADCYRGGSDDYRSIERFLLSKTGIKRFFVGLFFKKNSQAYCLSYPRNLGKYKDIDFLNEKKEAWPNPVTGELRNDSFMELFEKAKEKYLRLKALRIKSFEGEDVREEMKKETAGYNHDGTHEGEKMGHFSLVWKVE